MCRMSINLEFLYFIFLSENGPKFASFQMLTHDDSIYKCLNERSYEKRETWDKLLPQAHQHRTTGTGQLL